MHRVHDWALESTKENWEACQLSSSTYHTHDLGQGYFHFSEPEFPPL